MMDVYPSMLAMILSGFLMLAFLIILVVKARDGTLNLSTYEQLSLILGAGILVSIHGLAHAYSEVHYDFNPLQCHMGYHLHKKHHKQHKKYNPRTEVEEELSVKRY
jgi:hypothetical protein